LWADTEGLQKFKPASGQGTGVTEQNGGITNLHFIHISIKRRGDATES
jgi:hypothetical protein